MIWSEFSVTMVFFTTEQAYIVEENGEEWTKKKLEKLDKEMRENLERISV